MPSLLEHLNKAEHNERFYRSFELRNTAYLDWVVSGIFYSALHYIDSYLATNNKQPDNHGERIKDITNDQNLGNNIYPRFRSLKDDSEAGRYSMKLFSAGEIQQFIIPKLDEIKQYLKEYIPQIRLD